MILISQSEFDLLSRKPAFLSEPIAEVKEKEIEPEPAGEINTDEQTSISHQAPQPEETKPQLISEVHKPSTVIKNKTKNNQISRKQKKTEKVSNRAPKEKTSKPEQENRYPILVGGWKAW